MSMTFVKLLKERLYLGWPRLSGKISRCPYIFFIISCSRRIRKSPSSSSPSPSPSSCSLMKLAVNIWYVWHKKTCFNKYDPVCPLMKPVAHICLISKKQTSTGVTQLRDWNRNMSFHVLVRPTSLTPYASLNWIGLWPMKRSTGIQRRKGRL